MILFISCIMNYFFTSVALEPLVSCPVLDFWQSSRIFSLFLVDGFPRVWNGNLLNILICMRWHLLNFPLFLCTEDVTMVICPGIANHSEKQYIRTFVDYAQKNGYRCAVLNHLGALPNIELTSARMFTYGRYFMACGDLISSLWNF